MNTTISTTVKIEPETKARLKSLADLKNRNPHWVMKEAIHQYLDREETQEQLRQDVMSAWQNYETTGLHVTQTEAQDWMDSLISGQNIEPPECHD